jgi:hypothetical protein
MLTDQEVRVTESRVPEVRIPESRNPELRITELRITELRIKGDGDERWTILDAEFEPRRGPASLYPDLLKWAMGKFRHPPLGGVVQWFAGGAEKPIIDRSFRARRELRGRPVAMRAGYETR